MRRRLGRVLLAGADLALPVTCVACGVPGRALCRGCGRPLLVGPRPVVAVVLPGRSSSLPVRVAATYAGAVRTALLAHKEAGVLDLVVPLGDAVALGLAELLAGHRAGRVLVVPVPSDGAAVRARGQDHARRLAARACRSLRFVPGSPPVRAAPLLRAVRSRQDQAGLGRRARAGNLAGALGPRRGAAALLAGRDVVLVDDVVTTGATLAEAARALSGAGARVLGAAVVAAVADPSASPGRAGPDPQVWAAPAVPR